MSRHFESGASVNPTRPRRLRREDEVGKFRPRARRWKPVSDVAEAPARSGEALDRDGLVVKLLPLVRSLALRMRRILPAHIDVDDLIGAGSLGLLDAVRRFDVRKQVRIESYARHRIRGAILDSLRNLDSASRDMRQKTRNVEKAYRDVEARRGAPATDVEVAGELGVTLDEWHRTIRELQAVGLDGPHPTVTMAAKPIGDGNLVARNQLDPFERCCRLEQREILKRAIASLPRRERLIMSLYYEQPRTMKEIAVHLGVDQSRVSQLHAAALVRLRKRVSNLPRGPVPGFAPNQGASTARTVWPGAAK